jgi:archaemetzincin
MSLGLNAIHILNASAIPQDQLQPISALVGEVYGVAASIHPVSLNIAPTFDPSRGQYNSSALLAELLAHHTNGETKIIAIVDVDLFIPVLTFVFGEAQLSGRVAIVSTHRLHNEFYGMPPDHELFLQRLAKEVVHELGHTFGLYHCRSFDCVMRSSTYVEEIDLKRDHPCLNCHSQLSLM